MSKPKRTNDWIRKAGGVGWRDVWAWSDALRDEHGYWVDVIVSPPLPSQKGVLARVTVVAERQGGQQSGAHKVTRSLVLNQSSRATVEELALQCVTYLCQQLDAEIWRAEAASLSQGLLL